VDPGSCVAQASLPVAVRHAAQGVLPMDDVWHLIADQISDRVSGPMKFRIVLQPLMATFPAARSGLRHAKKGAQPYFYDIISSLAVARNCHAHRYSAEGSAISCA
jgi:hypothetical protein